LLGYSLGMFIKWQLNKFKNRRRIEDANSTRSSVLSDPFLKASYEDILDFQISLLLPLDFSSGIAELGSAGGITKLQYQGITTTDIRQGEGIDCLLNLDFTLPFEDSSLSGLIAKDVLHHISDPESHFIEVKRVLKNGGVVVYAEPNWNFVSRFVFTFLHPEPFDVNQHSWRFQSDDPMYSNQALPFIIFVRDLDLFKSRFPELKVEIKDETFNGLSFLLSGGVMQRTFIPSRLLLALKRLEIRNKFLMSQFGTIRIIKLTKIDS
jgi:SAM-dependent methyltransferase